MFAFNPSVIHGTFPKTHHCYFWIIPFSWAPNLFLQMPSVYPHVEVPWKVKVAQSCQTLFDPTEFSVHGILQARILERAAFPVSRGSSQPRDRTQVSTFLGDSLPAKPQGKPKITGVGSLSPLLQGIIPTQESNRGLLHYKQIVYQLSYQGSPGNPNSASLNSTRPRRNSSRFSLTGLWTHLLTPASPGAQVRKRGGPALIPHSPLTGEFSPTSLYRAGSHLS